MSEREKGQENIEESPSEMDQADLDMEAQDSLMESKDISRRQFLNYALMGTGGFLAAMPVVPMLRFAVDPLLQQTENNNMVKIGPVDQFNETPQRVTFKMEVKDGWYTSNNTFTAWVFKDKGEIVALSPICTHLGCTVMWEGSEQHENEFYCPCHGGRYTKDGVNIPNTPPKAPLAVYDQRIEDGNLYLGHPIPRKGA